MFADLQVALATLPPPFETAIARNEDADTIDQRIQAAEDGGLPLSLW